MTASVVAVFQEGHRNLDQPPTVLMFIMRAGECRRSGDTDGCKIHISSKPKTDVPSNSQDIATPASRAPRASRARRISEMNYLTTGWWPIRPGIPFGRNENDRLGVDDFAGCDPRSSFLQPDFDYVDILALLL